MKGWQAILIAAVTIFGAFMAVALGLPKQFRIERSVLVAAPMESVWAHLGDVRQHQAWAPWLSDPATTVTWGDTTTGQGAAYTWASGGSGSGAFTVSSANEPRRLDYAVSIDSIGDATGWFEATPEGDGSRVTWRFEGQNDGLLGGVVSMMMDRLVGQAFDEGLANLTALAEATPRPVVSNDDAEPVAAGTDPGGAMPPLP